MTTPSEESHTERSINCLVCGAALKDAIKEGGNYNQPHAGTTFTSHGHYGSTVWDPMPSWGGPNVWLEINVCDECLKRKAGEGTILVVKPLPRRTEYDVRAWTGPEDEAGL